MIRPVVLPLLVLALHPAGVSAQSTAPEYGQLCPSVSTVPVDLLKTAEDLRTARRFEGATHCLARAADRAALLHDEEAEGRARTAFAQVAFEQGLYTLAKGQAERALTLLTAPADRLGAARLTRLLGSVALMQGDNAEARRQYARALQTFTELGAIEDRLTTIVNQARLLSGAELEARLEDALVLARAAGDRSAEAAVLHLRGDKRFAAGRFAAAIDDLSRAIELFEVLQEGRHLADAYVSMGRIMRAHGRLDEALANYDRALALHAKTGDLRGRVQSLNAKAVALAQARRPAESRAAYEQALEIARLTGSDRLVNFQQGNLAASYGEAGEFAKAIGLLEDVLTRETEPYVLAYRHGALAVYLQATSQPERAVAHIQQAIAFARDTNNRDYLPNLLWRAALIYEAQGRTEAALAAASENVDLLESLRAHLVPLDYMKRGFSDTWQATYGVMIALLHDRGEHARALATSEMARARAFLDLLASRDLSDRVLDAPAAPAPADDVHRPSGAVATTATAAQIAETAARIRSTIVSYWVAGDETFIWVTGPDGSVHATSVRVSSDRLKALVETSVPTPGRRTTWQLIRLHALLVQPVAEWLPSRGESLTIVPHGPLFRLSFAALRDARGTYLVERHPIAYAPSISTLAMPPRHRAARTGASGYVLIADPAPLPHATPRFAPLPASRREAASIARVLGPGRTTRLEGPAAAESAVRRVAGGARVLHFATHGLIRDDDPFESYLALGRSGAGDADDGRLTVRELYDLRLQADLVVMSACRTATGPASGDGIAGLSRALFYAGTSSVLATLWDVADEPSAMLMARFYRNWDTGMDKHAALRLAQLDLLRRLRAGTVKVKTRLGVVPLREEPFYWAAYVFVGER